PLAFDFTFRRYQATYFPVFQDIATDKGAEALLVGGIQADKGVNGQSFAKGAVNPGCIAVVALFARPPAAIQGVDAVHLIFPAPHSQKTSNAPRDLVVT